MNVKPGGSIIAFCEPVTRTSTPHLSISVLTPPTQDTPSTTVNASDSSRTTRQISSIGLRMPVDVSQYVMNTALICLLFIRNSRTRSTSTGSPHSKSRRCTLTSCASQILAKRSPNEPVTNTNTSSLLFATFTTAVSKPP